MTKRLFPALLLAFGPTLLAAQYMADATPRSGVEELYKAGERAFRSGDQATAITLFTEVIANEPDHINALLQRGFCNSLQGAYDLAIRDFSAVIEHKADHTWAYTSRGSAYSKLGRHDLAIADFDKVLALDPKNEEAYNNRGWSRKATGDIGAACKDWNTSKRMGNAEAKIILTNNRCK